MWAHVVHELRDNGKWQRIAEEKCNQAFSDFLVKLEALEVEDIDAAVKQMTQAPVNLQDPIFSR